MEALSTYFLRLNCAQALATAACAPFIGQVSSKLDRSVTVIFVSILAQPAYLSTLHLLETFYLFKEIYLFTLALFVCFAAAITELTAVNLLTFWGNIAGLSLALYGLEAGVLNDVGFWIAAGATAVICSWMSISARMFCLSVASLLSFQVLLEEKKRQIALDSPGHYLHFGLLVSATSAVLISVDFSKGIARMLHAGIGSFAVLCFAYVLTRSWSVGEFKAKGESLRECQRVGWGSSLEEVPLQCGAVVASLYPLLSLGILPRDAGARWFWLSSLVLVLAACVLVNERETTQSALFYTFSAVAPALCLLHFVKQSWKGKDDEMQGLDKRDDDRENWNEPEEEVGGEQESVSTPAMKRAVLEREIEGSEEATKRIRTELFQVQQRMFQLEAQSYGEVDPEKKKEVISRLEGLKETAKKLEQRFEESSEAKKRAQQALDTVKEDTLEPKLTS